ncbi:MAG: putative DNA binding domain-containing protein [Acidimicrobiia bacterium]|nr:putative DNA binding domain-containing protein [Acidimicrobiia bacterium]
METALLILGILIAGFIFGSIARFLVPGHQPFSLAETTIIGMVGAAIGAIAVNAIFGTQDVDRLDLGSIVGGIVGSVIVLIVATVVVERFGWRDRQDSVEPSIADVIEGGESTDVEFKSTSRWNLHTGSKDDRMELAVTKTVAGFLNSDGGTLIVGVDDDGRPVGLEHDLSLMKAPDHDRYELWLTDHLQKTLGKPAMTFVSIRFEPYLQSTVVVIAVSPSDRPVFVNEPKGNRTADFYVRMGNSTRKLLTDEFADYQASRWR